MEGKSTGRKWLRRFLNFLMYGGWLLIVIVVIVIIFAVSVLTK